MKSYFVFDVESMGLHGEGFAVAGGVYLENGAVQWEFAFTCDPDAAFPANIGTNDTDREWVKHNVPVLEITHRCARAMRNSFWEEWEKARNGGAVMAADCAWPVEAKFVGQCVFDTPGREGPYPFHEIASFLQAAGMDPLKTYDRTPSELPRHNPLCDARQSARLLSMAISKLEK